jgi:hypothetical protein
LYTGSDGQSHLEPLDLSGHVTLPTAALVFRRFVDVDQPRHTAPRRQLAFVLSGVLEIECIDDRVALEAGDAVLIEDTTGAGHLTRLIGDTWTANIPVADDLLPREHFPASADERR